jgi:antitoxin VapB
LIVEPVRRRPDLATLLAGWEPLDEVLPDVDEGLLPLDDIRL